MQILKRRSDAIYLTEMGAFIARRIIRQSYCDSIWNMSKPVCREWPGFVWMSACPGLTL
ncbi:hypothetical protein K1N90_002524 [Salmonella enterica]|uniref:Uncharacterized protein n=1 Tax=Salmonella muenchen TaxID=596 RepID=A0A8E7P0G7_SALMU|nr:hypothetical protein [Salmonella enterica subsp. enterica serovar Muenchen]EEF4121318.1 hypothetical protein [Salmonella enterica]EEE8356790.1 hypothetical protein [Salmonella enterica subsp. enterica serovar Muenchen]EEL3533645.1 hypothetical protein [Salmonella enterica]EFP4568492.1 hypothetical protein [Salmonella enterica]